MSVLWEDVKARLESKDSDPVEQHIHHKLKVFLEIDDSNCNDLGAEDYLNMVENLAWVITDRFRLWKLQCEKLEFDVDAISIQGDSMTSDGSGRLSIVYRGVEPEEEIVKVQRHGYEGWLLRVPEEAEQMATIKITPKIQKPKTKITEAGNTGDELPKEETEMNIIEAENTEMDITEAEVL